jgi:GrpB-like predicted nucleotidyltransferase (UPF0157 family)
MEASPDRTRVVIVPYDPAWPDVFAGVESEVRALLSGRALDVIHVGSTAIPGLAAKPVVDVTLIVDDSSDESTYLPDLTEAGFALVVREPDWNEHRMLKKRSHPSINLHVFSRGCDEVERLVRFRDWLRTHDDDRDLYARTKQELAARSWERVQDYADAKTTVVTEILERATAG